MEMLLRIICKCCDKKYDPSGLFYVCEKDDVLCTACVIDESVDIAVGVSEARFH